MWSAIPPAAARTLRIVPANRLALQAARAAANQTTASSSSSFAGFARLGPVKRCFATTRTVRAASPAAATTKTEKPAADKTATKKKTAKKSAAKPKKAAAEKRVRKPLTPEEKAKLDVRQLRKVALLEEPARLPATAWLVFTSQRNKGSKLGGGGGGNIGSVMREASEAFKSLSSFELEVHCSFIGALRPVVVAGESPPNVG